MRNMLKECTRNIISNFWINHQLKFLSKSLWQRSRIFSCWILGFILFLGLSLGASRTGYCSKELVEAGEASAFKPGSIQGLDLIRGLPRQIDFKEARLGTVVLFLSTRCPCSASHQVTLESLSKKFIPLGFKFVGVHSNADEEVGAAREYFKQSGLTFPVIQDKHTQIADALGAFKTPHVFVLSSEGEILFQGGVDNSHIAQAASKHYLQDALTLIAGGKKPSQKEVRVLGCEIRR